MSSKQKRNPLGIILGLSALFFCFFLIVSGAFYLYRSPVDFSRRTGSPLFGSGAVGVIEVRGVIMDSKRTLKRLEKFEEDSEVKAVVLRLESPGGAVAPSQEIYEAVKRYKKPLVVSMGSIAASGAYYIACGAKKVFANPGTITGSIGVIMEFANLEKLYEWAKIKRYVIKTGKFKDAGAEFREMSSEERTLLQGMVDDVLGQFKQVVAEGRKLSLAQVSAVADGRILSGAQAKRAKLVDELGTVQDAINEAGKLAKIKGKPRVIYPERNRRKWMEMILNDGLGPEDETGAEQENSVSLNAWVQRILGQIASLPSSLKEPGMSFGPGIYWLWNGAH